VLRPGVCYYIETCRGTAQRGHTTTEVATIEIFDPPGGKEEASEKQRRERKKTLGGTV
jgi:hypothetical protein